MRNAFTVDVEDYYHVSAFTKVIDRTTWPLIKPRVQNGTMKLLDLLRQTNSKATFFFLGIVARDNPSLVRSVVQEGHELACHGMEHIEVYKQDRDAFLRDILASKKIIEDIAGTEVRGYRAPCFSIGRGTWWAFDMLEHAGYRYSSSTHPIRHDRYSLSEAPRTPFKPGQGREIIEIPVSTIEVNGYRVPCGGGGFFRLLPYRATHRAIRHVNCKERSPFTFYIHPWELDVDQPQVKGAGIGTSIRHRIGLRGAEMKVMQLLKSFKWSRMADVYRSELDGSVQIKRFSLG